MAGGESGNVSLPLRVLWTRLGYLAVRKLARLGVQLALWQYACVKAVPSLAKASIVGVFSCGLPSAPIVSKRCWSLQYQTVFGGRSGLVCHNLGRGAVFPEYRLLAAVLGPGRGATAGSAGVASQVPSGLIAGPRAFAGE